MFPTMDLNKAIINGVIGDRRNDSHPLSSTRAYDKVFCEREYSVTIGIFFINPTISMHKEAFYQYLDRFDTLSGTRMDFYLPGFYRDEGDKWIKTADPSYDFEMSFKNNTYYFSKKIYDDMASFIGGQIPDVKINNNLNPKLLIVDVDIDTLNETVKYKDSFMIDLKDEDIEKNYLFKIIDFFSECAKDEICGKYRTFRYYKQIRAKKLFEKMIKALPSLAAGIAINIVTAPLTNR